jgi:hypothetical protein
MFINLQSFYINQFSAITLITQAEEDLLHIVEVFYFALFVLFILPFVTIYFLPNNNTANLTWKGIGKIFLLELFFIPVFLIIEYISNPGSSTLYLLRTESEFLIFSIIWLTIFVTIFFPYYVELLKQSIVYESDLDKLQLKKSIEDSVSKLRGRQIITTRKIPDFFQYQVPGPYYLKYKLNVLIGEKEKDSKSFKVNFIFSHSVRNLNMLKLIFFIMFGVILLARGSWNLQPIFISYTIDSEIIFALFVFAFIIFNLLIAYSCENLIFQREAVYKQTLLNLKQINLSKPNLEEIKQKARARLGILDDKPNIEEIKKKAQAKIDFSVQKAEQEKRERIDKLLDRADSKLDPKINPEIIRMESLIREIRKILNATPEANSIDLKEIVKMIGSKKTTVEEVEQMIIGLVNRKEVRGEYDIWAKSYRGGNVRTRFMNRTLESLKIKKEEIARLKVSGDTMEVTFHSQNDEDKSISSDSKKKASK